MAQEELPQTSAVPLCAWHSPSLPDTTDPTPTLFSIGFPAAVVPRHLRPRSAASSDSYTQHWEHKGKQPSALRAYLPHKEAGHFCLLSANEWHSLGCEISLQVLLWARLLAGSWRLHYCHELIKYWNCLQLFQGSIIEGPWAPTWKSWWFNLRLPAIVLAQQFSQNILYKQQDLIFSASAVTKPSVVRDFWGCFLAALSAAGSSSAQQ